MKTIGLIGGMSWESTTSYYQIINETATAVVALAGKALGVLVREGASHRLHHGEGHEEIGRAHV